MEENNTNQEMNLQGEQVQPENQPVVTQEAVQQVSPITIEQNQIAAVQSQETVQNQPELNQSTNTTEEFLKAKKHLKLEFLIIGIIYLVSTIYLIMTSVPAIKTLVDSEIEYGSLFGVIGIMLIVSIVIKIVFTIMYFIGFALVNKESKAAGVIGMVLGILAMTTIFQLDIIDFIIGLIITLDAHKYLKYFKQTN